MIHTTINSGGCIKKYGQYHQKMIDTVIIFIQWGIFLPALSLAVISRRTSRARVDRHEGFTAIACLLGLASAVLTLVQLALIFAGIENADLVLSFLPPGLTTAACVATVLRGLDARAVQPYRG
jgi:hypothetical protein